MSKFYLTTAIPYVNAKPHLGHALEYVIADVIHRFQEINGKDTFFVSGADENSLKNVQAAEKEGISPKEFLDKYAQIFKEFYLLLDVHLDEFRRGTDEQLHWPGVQNLWEKANTNGDIYKKSYTGLYCIGCEAFKTQDELIDGKCPNHNKEPELIKEENYFFKLSNYQSKLTKLIESDELKIYPQKRKNEVLAFIKAGLEDFSISRSNDRARGVGVPVPNDDTQKMYVWFDALNIYMTGIGYGYDSQLWKKYWPADLHVIGKDITRFHAIYWPAMLLSAKLPLPKSILVHGFITSGGVKMSKSLGNVIDPYELITKYGVEPLRYFLLSQIPTLDDGDFTIEQFENIYTAHLSNGLGNLVSRVAKLCERSGFDFEIDQAPGFRSQVTEQINTFQLHLALEAIWKRISQVDQLIDERQPWKLEGQPLKSVLQTCVAHLRQIGFELQPFLPRTANTITSHFRGPKIAAATPLFPRLK